MIVRMRDVSYKLFAFTDEKCLIGRGLELQNFYNLKVSYVTAYIIRSDYDSVADKFRLKNTTVRTGN